MQRLVVLSGSLARSREMLKYFNSALPQSWYVHFYESADELFTGGKLTISDGDPVHIIVVDETATKVTGGFSASCDVSASCCLRSWVV
jgi:hypothetical protein